MIIHSWEIGLIIFGMSSILLGFLRVPSKIISKIRNNREVKE